MKKWMGILVLLGAVSAQAKTQVQFLGIQAMINLITAGDTDAQTLYDKMNIPPKDSNLGPGKAIKTAGKELNWVCSNSNARGYICTMVLSRSNDTQLSAQKMSYEVTGTKAHELWQKMILDSNQEFHFITDDHLFKIDSTQDHFVLMYDSAGFP